MRWKYLNSLLNTSATHAQCNDRVIVGCLRNHILVLSALPLRINVISKNIINRHCHKNDGKLLRRAMFSGNCSLRPMKNGLHSVRSRSLRRHSESTFAKRRKNTSVHRHSWFLAAILNSWAQTGPSLAQRIWIFISSPGTARIGSSLTNWNGSERIGKTFTQLHEADGFGLNCVDWRQFAAFRKR